MKVGQRLKVVLGLTVLFGSSESPSCRERRLVEEIRREYCQFPEDDPEGLRRAWGEELAQRGEPVRSALLVLAKSKGDPDRWCGMWYLLVLQDPRLIPSLRQILSDDGEENLFRVMAIDGLGLLDDADALDSIMPFLESSNSQLVAAAVRYLGRIDDERARELLRRAGATLDEIYLVEVADGLAAQRDRQAVALLAEIGLRRDLQRRNEIRSRVAMALAEIGGAESWPNAVEVIRLIDAADHCRWTIDAVAQNARSRLGENGHPDERLAMEEALRQLDALRCPSP